MRSLDRSSRLGIGDKVEGRSRSSDQSSSWEIGLKIDPQKTRRGFVGRRRDPKMNKGEGSSFFRPRRWKMGGLFVLLAPKIEDGGTFLVLRSRKIEKPPPSSKSPHLRRSPPPPSSVKFSNHSSDRRSKMGGSSIEDAPEGFQERCLNQTPNPFRVGGVR